MKIKLHVRNFRSSMDWFRVCGELGVDITSTTVTIKIETATGEQEKEETELCEGCNKEVPVSEMSDVMEMYICNKCEEGNE